MLHCQADVAVLDYNLSIKERLAVLVAAIMNRIDGVRMSDCCLQGIQPCKCKVEEHRWIVNQVFRLLGLTKE